MIPRILMEKAKGLVSKFRVNFGNEEGHLFPMNARQEYGLAWLIADRIDKEVWETRGEFANVIAEYEALMASRRAPDDAFLDPRGQVRRIAKYGDEGPGGTRCYWLYDAEPMNPEQAEQIKKSNQALLENRHLRSALRDMHEDCRELATLVSDMKIVLDYMKSHPNENAQRILETCSALFRGVLNASETISRAKSPPRFPHPHPHRHPDSRPNPPTSPPTQGTGG